MITTTLKDIRAAGPCETFDTLLDHLGKTRTEAKTDTNPLPVLTVLESNGLDDALWVLDNVVGNKMICRLFAADCAERVLHLFEAERPNDARPREAIAVARRPSATEDDLRAARDAWAAGDAAWAARAAAGAAAGAAWAARAAAGAAWAARAAARDAAWAAAGAARAAGDAARDAAWAAARAAGDAARDAAWAAARAAQASRLRQYLEHGEAAADMPWETDR